MSVNLVVSDNIAQHLTKLADQERGDIDRVLNTLLETEYRRRLMRYRLIDQQMQQKYHMDSQHLRNSRSSNNWSLPGPLSLMR